MARQPGQRGAQIRQTILGPFADEACRNVQIRGRAPFDARRGAQSVEQGVETADYFGGKIQTREQTHALVLSHRHKKAPSDGPISCTFVLDPRDRMHTTPVSVESVQPDTPRW